MSNNMFDDMFDLSYDPFKNITTILIKFPKLLNYNKIFNTYQQYVQGVVKALVSVSSDNYLEIVLDGQYQFIDEIYDLPPIFLEQVDQQLQQYIKLNLNLSIQTILVKIITTSDNHSDQIILQPIDFITHELNVIDGISLTGTNSNDLKNFQMHLSKRN